MSAVLLTPPYLQFFSGGTPLAGGKVYTYTSTGGTFATPKATYTTAAGNISAPNPVILDSSGIPETGGGSIWLAGTYDFKVTDADDNLIKTTLAVTAFQGLASASSSYFQSFSGNASDTAFTTSTSLGTDEKLIFVWVDAGAGKGYEIQNPSAYTISGTTLTFASAPASGTNNIYVSAPSLAANAASAASNNAATSEANALAAEVGAEAAEAAALAYANRLTGTSTTSLAISVASKIFTTQAGKFFDVGNFLIATSDADPTNYMHGQVTAYSGTSLTLNVIDTGGSGTHTDWTIKLSGTRGAIGATGSINDLSGITPGTLALADKFIFDDVSAADVTRSCTVTDVLKYVYPIGSTYLNKTDPTSPATLFGFGTWVAETDKFIVSHGSTFTTNGGATTAALDMTNLPTTITGTATFTNTDDSEPGATTKYAKGDVSAGLVTGNISIANSGGGQPFSIIPSYQAYYIWVRTA